MTAIIILVVLAGAGLSAGLGVKKYEDYEAQPVRLRPPPTLFAAFRSSR